MNVKKSVLIICFMLMLTTIPLSQANVHYNTNNTDNTWMQTYGRFFNDEMGISVQQTNDGGFIVVGAKSRSLIDIHGHRDVWLIKLDETGSVIWDKTFGGWGNDVGNSVQQTLDGGYIITGYTESYSNGKKDVWLIKTDEQGKKLWDKSFGYSDFDSGSEVKQTSDGGYIIIGNVNTSGGGRGDVWLIKVDSNGNKQWDKSFGGKGHNYADEIQQTQDEGYIIIGSSWIPDESNSYDMWLIKVDKNGNMMWDKKFNRSESDHGWSIDQTVDGGFIIAGETNHGSDDKVWLLKTDESGNKIWDKTFEGRGFSVQQTNEGGYIIAGAAMNPTKTDFSNGLLIKTDSNGEQEWRKTFGGRKPDFLFSVQQTTDNGYIATGHTPQSWFDSGLWLIKIDSDDNTYTKQTATDKDIFIDGKIKCPTKPFIKGHKEKFYVTLNNKGNDEIAAMVEFRLWDHKDKEWKFFGESRCTIPPSHIKDTDADDVSITWPGCWFQEPWSPLWPGMFGPREIRAELYVDDVLVDTQESRYFMGFFIF